MTPPAYAGGGEVAGRLRVDRAHRAGRVSTSAYAGATIGRVKTIRPAVLAVLALALPDPHDAALIVDALHHLAEHGDGERQAHRCRTLADSIGDALDEHPSVPAVRWADVD